MSQSDPLQDSLDISALPQMTESMDLVVKAQDGDSEALNDLLTRYHMRVQRVVRIRLGARLRRHLESVDILQETFQVAAQKIDDLELRSPGSILQWLSKIAEHKIKDANDYFSAQKRDTRREVPLEVRPASPEGDAIERDFSDGQPTPDEEAMRGEFRELLDEAMMELKPEHREVILLRDYFGGEWEFVAEETGRPGNVHATQELHRRAWIKLRQIVSPKVRDLRS